jgi:DNA polymerase-3 subunit beta
MISAKLFCKALKFAAHAAGTKDIRYYLNGVRLEWREDTLRFIGTDGAVLALAEVRTPLMGACEMTITNDCIKFVLSALSKADGEVNILIMNATEKEPASGLVVHASGSFPLKCTGGRYPDWTRIVPPAIRESAPMPAGVSTGLLSNALKALGALDGSKWPGAAIKAGLSDPLIIRSFKPNPELLDYFVIIQPLRA